MSRYVLTDQAYVQKLIKTNIAENSSSSARVSRPLRKQQSSKSSQQSSSDNISFTPLDWETDIPTRALIPGSSSSSASSFDAVLAVDCVYNYALIPPLVSTCAEACRLRGRDDDGGDGDNGAAQTLCIVAQQLRNDDVFCSWLREFTDKFRVWRVRDQVLPEELRSSAGFVVHVGVLRH